MQEDINNAINNSFGFLSTRTYAHKNIVHISISCKYQIDYYDMKPSALRIVRKGTSKPQIGQG